MIKQAVIKITGQVQGVGFRPFVYRIAIELGMTGWVKNTLSGVEICICQQALSPARVKQFMDRLVQQAPPNAQLFALDMRIDQLENSVVPEDFRIIDSEIGQHQAIEVLPDIALCRACVAELKDVANRRHHHLFINCVHCGPRYSLLRKAPYDRDNTSMAVFEQCAVCFTEYSQPSSRRFHAQPNACPACGPTMTLLDSAGEKLISVASASALAKMLERITKALQQDAIVAIKGVGGFQLICNGASHTAVERLRRLKKRPAKPFAVMFESVEQLQKHCEVSSLELALLQTSEAPIVLLKQLSSSGLTSLVNPNLNKVGAFLPYSALHYLLLAHWGHPLVVTSANAIGEPICAHNEHVRQQFKGKVAYFLVHDRDILHRSDDSVVMVANEHQRLMRRSRGYAPTSIQLPSGFEHAPEILGLGGELKNTFCYFKNGRAYMSPHMGDLEKLGVYLHWQRSMQEWAELFNFKPQQLVIDQHPEYLSSKYGRQLAKNDNAYALTEVQHHHAHAAACLVEHAYPLTAEPVFVLALDGHGWGDGEASLWGGECLLVDYRQSRRLGQLENIPMLGGSNIMTQPWRSTLAHLYLVDQGQSLQAWLSRFGDLPLMAFINQQPWPDLIKGGRRAMQTSSFGRLFDAMAALVCVLNDNYQVTYEGEAAMQLQSLVTAELMAQASPYPFTIMQQASGYTVLSVKAFWPKLLEDLSAGVDNGTIAANIHQTLIDACVEWLEAVVKSCQALSTSRTVVLTGGVFQNEWLLSGIEQKLSGRNYQVMSPHHYPTNDGGISLGQVAIAAARCLPAEGTVKPEPVKK